MPPSSSSLLLLSAGMERSRSLVALERMVQGEQQQQDHQASYAASDTSKRHRRPENRTSPRAANQFYIPFFGSASISTVVWSCWTLHFALSISCLIWASVENGGSRKYISMDVSPSSSSLQWLPEEDRMQSVNRSFESYHETEPCQRGYVDVYAASADEPGAWVCCDSNANTEESYENPGIYTGLCQSPPGILFMSRRLAKFPDAWLLPLLPLLLRYVIYGIQKMNQQNSCIKKSGDGGGLISKYTWRRFCMYLGLIQFRGWILYLLLNTLEDTLFMFLSRTEEDDSCWYRSYLDGGGRESCRTGRTFDFSDHVVLYFAQILPLALMESIQLYKEYATTTSSKQLHGQSSSRAENLWPVLLSASLTTIYLYVVALLGAYKTAAYFHTPGEIAVGYLLSCLTVQVPLCWWQGHPGVWPRGTAYFFGTAGMS